MMHRIENEGMGSPPDIVFQSLFPNLGENDGVQPNSHLLKVGGITLLLDCGVDETYSLYHLNVIARALTEHQVDYLLLSYAAISQVGALPYLQAQGKLENVKIMSTSPTSKMASLTMYEYFIQRKELSDFHLFTLFDVEKAFEKVELVSFNEHRKIKSHMKSEETEIILSAHPSGSAIGGTCWKIEYNKQLIVYA